MDYPASLLPDESPFRVTIEQEDLLKVEMRGSGPNSSYEFVVSATHAIGASYSGCCVTIHCYPEPNRGSKRVYEGKDVAVESETVAENMVKAIKAFLDAEFKRGSLRALVLINPNSGLRRSARIFAQTKVVFDHAGMEYDEQQTTHQGHAGEICKNLDLNIYDRIIICSGDGLVHEALNGLMSREDWEEALVKVSIGHLPAGSGNGLAKSVCFLDSKLHDPTTAAYIIAKGRSRALDIFSCTQQDDDGSWGVPLFGFLSISWALISDIDLQSEKCRCCGPARFTFAGICRICMLTKYKATLSFVPAADEPTDAPYSHKFDENRRCRPLCMKKEGDEEKEQGPDGFDKLKLLKENAMKVGEKLDNEHDWVDVEGDFTMIWAMNVSHGATDMMPAPHAHVDDGFIDLTYTRKIGRCGMLGMFLNMEDGRAINHQKHEYVKVSAFRLEPGNKHTPLAIDGEELPCRTTEVRMFPRVLRIIAS